MKSIATRILYGTLFAIPLMLLTYAFAQARSPEIKDQQQEVSTEQDCKSCHPAFYEVWENGLHGQAWSDPAFQNAWQDQGEPVECLVCHVTGYDSTNNTWDSDGITCLRCHSPVPANHPSEPMPVARSSELCGECHTETNFQWQASVHRQHDLGCETCHDPHGSQLLAQDDSTLCATCQVESIEDPLDPMISAETSSVMAAPKPVNPLGFALLAGLVGLAAGVVLAPWIERFQNRLDMDDKE
jgi:predicted CXXCH cytochrome family protein